MKSTPPASSHNNIGCWYKKDNGISKKSCDSDHHYQSCSSLDIYCQNSPTYTEWTRSQRRCYQRVKSGLKRHQGERLRFMTLTTPTKPKRELSKAFGVLKHRIKRVRVKKLEDEGYLKKGDVRKIYEGKYKIGLPFEYLKVETREGANGVYHVLYFGDYIPQAWLSEQWEDIMGAKIVDIRATKKKVGDTKKLARYCIGQYCAGQSEFVRYSWSWKWVFRGFVRVWTWVLERVGVRKGIELWERIMLGERVVYEQEGQGYSVGDDPPYVRKSVWGKWMDVLADNPVMFRCG